MNLHVTESYLKRKHFLEIRIDSVPAKVGLFFGYCNFALAGVIIQEQQISSKPQQKKEF